MSKVEQAVTEFKRRRNEDKDYNLIAAEIAVELDLTREEIGEFAEGCNQVFFWEKTRELIAKVRKLPTD